MVSSNKIQSLKSKQTAYLMSEKSLKFLILSHQYNSQFIHYNSFIVAKRSLVLCSFDFYRQHKLYQQDFIEQCIAMRAEFMSTSLEKSYIAKLLETILSFVIQVQI